MIPEHISCEFKVVIWSEIRFSGNFLPEFYRVAIYRPVNLGIFYGEILFDIQNLNKRNVFSQILTAGVFWPIFSFYNTPATHKRLFPGKMYLQPQNLQFPPWKLNCPNVWYRNFKQKKRFFSKFQEIFLGTKAFN